MIQLTYWAWSNAYFYLFEVLKRTSWKVEKRDPRFHMIESRGSKREPLGSLKRNVSSNELGGPYDG